MKLIKNLKIPKLLFAAVGTAFVAFDVCYVFMAYFPGSRDEMCVMGANLTMFNVIYSLFISLMVGLTIAGFWALADEKIGRKKKIAAGSLTGIGAGLGLMTVFCTACTLPVISLFGLSMTLEFFTYNSDILKIVSFVMIGVSVYLLERQLQGKCERCAVYEKPVYEKSLSQGEALD